jgi:hypothetical protein
MRRGLPVQQPADALMPSLAENEQHRQSDAALVHPHRHTRRPDPHRLAVKHAQPIPPCRDLRTEMLDRVRFEDQPAKHLGGDPRHARGVGSAVFELDRHRGTTEASPLNHLRSRPDQPGTHAWPSVRECTPTPE